MRKAVITAMSLMLALGMTACGSQKTEDTDIIGGADEPTTIELSSTVGKEDNANATADDADAHFIEYLKGNETDSDGKTFWAIGQLQTEYALYDMNGDGVNELLVRSYGSWIFDILEYKDNKIQLANVENMGSSGVTLINDKNQFVSGDTGHEGRAMYVVSEIDDKGETQIVMAFMKYWDDWAASGSPEFYKKENPSRDYLENTDKFDSITEEEYNSLVDEYSKENTSINWMTLE